MRNRHLDPIQVVRQVLAEFIVILNIFVNRHMVLVDQADQLWASLFEQARLPILVGDGVLWNGELRDLLQPLLVIRTRNA